MVNIPVNITGTRFIGLGFTFGDGTDAVNVNSLNSSFGLGAADLLWNQAGSSLRLVNTTVHGGGLDGAINTLDGSLTVESSTVTSNGRSRSSPTEPGRYRCDARCSRRPVPPRAPARPSPASATT